MAPSAGEQIYTRHQQHFRELDQEGAAIAEEWRLKTVKQRKLWLAAHEKVWSAEDEVGRLADRKMIDTVGRIATKLDEDVRDLPDLMEGIEQNYGPYENLRDAWRAAGEAWRYLATVEDRQARTRVDASVRGAEGQATLRDGQAELANYRLRWFDQERNLAATGTQLVPSDGQGREIIPATWYSDNSATATLETSMGALRRDLDEAKVGMHGTAGQYWIAQARHGELVNGIEGWLWLYLDANNTVIDRVYRKTCIFSVGEWADVRLFDGDARDPSQRVPWEVACHDALMDVEDLEHVVRMRERLADGGSLVDDRLMLYNVYMEWCAHSDLNDLIKTYKRRKGYIPEAFIWYVAEALAEGGIAMTKGTLVDVGDPPEGWRPMVHRDIKPGNVFLADPSDDRYRAFPTPKLGDFGQAFRTSANDPNNPRWYQNCGTEGFTAPEMNRYVDRQAGVVINTWRLTEKTDVYSIGVVLYCLLTCNEGPKQPIWLGDGTLETTLYPMQLPVDDEEMEQQGEGEDEEDDSVVAPASEMEEEEEAEEDEQEQGAPDDDEAEDEPEAPAGEDPVAHIRAYSLPLRRLINACLRFKPRNRPTMAELRGLIQQTLAGGGYDDALQLTQALRTGGFDGGADQNDAEMEYADDLYRVHMTAAELPDPDRWD